MACYFRKYIAVQLPHCCTGWRSADQETNYITGYFLCLWKEWPFFSLCEHIFILSKEVCWASISSMAPCCGFMSFPYPVVGQVVCLCGHKCVDTKRKKKVSSCFSYFMSEIMTLTKLDTGPYGIWTHVQWHHQILKQHERVSSVMRAWNKGACYKQEDKNGQFSFNV